MAVQESASLLYGEVLPAGVTKLLDADHLDAGSAEVLFDLGMGRWCICVSCIINFLISN